MGQIIALIIYSARSNPCQEKDVKMFTYLSVSAKKDIPQRPKRRSKPWFRVRLFIIGGKCSASLSNASKTKAQGCKRVIILEGYLERNVIQYLKSQVNNTACPLQRKDWPDTGTSLVAFRFPPRKDSRFPFLDRKAPLALARLWAIRDNRLQMLDSLYIEGGPSSSALQQRRSYSEV